MRAVCIAVMVALLALPAACGEAFSASEGAGGSAGGGGATPTPLRMACERYCAQAVGCPDVGEDQVECVDNCVLHLDETGACAPAAVALVDCYRTQASGCALPDSCLGAAAAYARCKGFGCDASVLNCGGSMQYDCWCSGTCGGTWTVSTPCNEDAVGNNLLCSCALTGPLVPFGPIGTVTGSCQGPAANACADDWGCCRALLLP